MKAHLFALLVVAGGAFLFGFEFTALGVLAAAPLALFNEWLLLSAIKKTEELPAAKGQSIILKRSFLRLLLSVGALLLAALGGVEFLIGVLLGLTLKVFLYILEALRKALSLYLKG